MRTLLRFTLLYATVFLFIAPAYAQESGFWVGIGGYTLRPNNPSTNKIYMGGTQPPVPDYYFPESVSQITSANVSVFFQFNQLTYKDVFCYPLSYRLGLTYLIDDNIKTEGKVKNSDEVDYHYSYKNLLRALFVDLQIDLFPQQWLGPYLDMGIGVARSLVSDYGESTVHGEIPRASPAFTSHIGYPLIFRIGAGINYEFELSATPIVLSLAYLYQNLGGAQTGNSNYYPRINQHLSERITGSGFEFSLRVFIE